MRPNETLLIIRQNLIKSYKKYEYMLIPLLKFIIIFSVIRMISSSVGYIGVLNKIGIVLFLSLVGTFLPEKWLILGFVLLMPIYVVMVNPILGIAGFIFLWLLYLLFMRLFPKESLLIVATIVCFNMGIEAVLPILAGLFGGYVCIIAIIIGVFIWFVMPQFALIVESTSLGKTEILDAFSSLSNSGIKNIISDKTMLSVMVVFFIVFSIVYIIRKQSIDYAAYLAIVIGSAMNLAGFIMAILFLDINILMPVILLTTILSAIIAVIVQFFSQVLDYQRAEVVNFEDEENYYYVKIIPKINVNTSNKKIKRVYDSKVEHKDYMNGGSIGSLMNNKEANIDE